MAIFKDGITYRTRDEQLTHLTEAHREQLEINKNVQKELQKLSISANYGGYNYVRFAFQKRPNKTYYRLKQGFVIKNDFGVIGDFIEITSKDKDDIPAYGYIGENNVLIMSDKSRGDFADIPSIITVINTSSGREYQINVVEHDWFETFSGTSLIDFNANDVKKQLFTILDDVSLNSQTQYVSFDLNGDSIYSFVLVFVNSVGKDGVSTTVASLSRVDYVIPNLKPYDSCIRMDNFDVVQKNLDGTISIVGNIRGARGERGYQGVQGEQGIQGVQGVQGIKGDKGDKGDSGTSPIRIFSGVLNNVGELPEFSSANIGDAYRIINTSGSIVTYDLYFKAYNGTDWDIQPNWGGIKGDKGDRGEQGIQGVQGVQGERGPKGDSGTYKPYTHCIRVQASNDGHIYNLVFESGVNYLYTRLKFMDIINKNLNSNGGNLDSEQIGAMFRKISVVKPYVRDFYANIVHTYVSLLDNGESWLVFQCIGSDNKPFKISLAPGASFQDSVFEAI